LALPSILTESAEEEDDDEESSPSSNSTSLIILPSVLNAGRNPMLDVRTIEVPNDDNLPREVAAMGLEEVKARAAARVNLQENNGEEEEEEDVFGSFPVFAHLRHRRRRPAAAREAEISLHIL